MLKKFLTAAYLLALTATPVHALPFWATAIARSQCEYIAMGVDWETATDQALRDNEIWADEFLRNQQLSAKAIVTAAYEICPVIFRQAFDEYERKQQQPVAPAFRNQEFNF